MSQANQQLQLRTLGRRALGQRRADCASKRIDESEVQASAEASWLNSPELRAVFRGHKEALIAYELAAAKGQVGFWKDSQ